MCACTNCLSETKNGLKSKWKTFFFFFVPVNGCIRGPEFLFAGAIEERCHFEGPGAVLEPQLQILLCTRQKARVQPLGRVLASSSSSLCFKATSKTTGLVANGNKMQPPKQ